MASSISQSLWNARVPLHITYASSPEGAAPFIVSVPRFSYLALLLPRLSGFFGTPCSSFHFENVQLRNLAVGLLLDLYQPSLPWRLTVNDGVAWDIGDTFINCVKEADYIRNGNANQIMKMSAEDTTQLWHAVLDNDFPSFHAINKKLLNAPTALKNIPIRIYIPLTPTDDDDLGDSDGGGGGGGRGGVGAGTGGDLTVLGAGSFRVVQSLIPANTITGIGGARRSPQMLGQALRDMMPMLFPNSKSPVLATAILHGAPVPFEAPLEELMREAAYPDGWLCFVVVV